MSDAIMVKSLPVIPNEHLRNKGVNGIHARKQDRDALHGYLPVTLELFRERFGETREDETAVTTRKQLSDLSQHAEIRFRNCILPRCSPRGDWKGPRKTFYLHRKGLFCHP
jgi:hypothetical protein